MLFTFLVMSTLPAYFMLVAALILFYSAHLLPLSYFLSDSIFSFCLLSFVHFVHYCSCLFRILFLHIYYLNILFTTLLLAKFCSSLLVYHRFAITSICSANHHLRIYYLQSWSYFLLVIARLLRACFCPLHPLCCQHPFMAFCSSDSIRTASFLPASTPFFAFIPV